MPFVWYKGMAVCDGGITDNIAKPTNTRRHITVFDTGPSWIRVLVPPTLGLISTQRTTEDVFQIVRDEYERSIAVWTKKIATHDRMYMNKKFSKN
jgi:hypothetical protein